MCFINSFAAMRIAGYILTFYLALLSIIPCCAFDSCPEDKQTEQAANHENGDEDCGSCSPFFNCEGCASVSINIDNLAFTLAPCLSQRIYTEFLQPFIPEVHYEFWQPPKLV